MPKWVPRTQLPSTWASFYFEAAADAKQLPGDYDGREIVAHLSFSEEFAARSWAQVSGSHANGCKQQLMVPTGTVTLP